MNSNETIKKIKVMLGMETAEAVVVPEAASKATVEVTLSEGKLADGTVVSYDRLEVGGLLSTVDAEGTAVPATAGEYELEDGTKVTVAEGGIIETVVMPKAPEAETEVPEVTIEARMLQAEDNIAQILSILGAQTLSAQTIQTELAEAKTKLEELANAPSDVPVHLASQKEQTQEPSVFQKRVQAIENLKK